MIAMNFGLKGGWVLSGPVGSAASFAEGRVSLKPPARNSTPCWLKSDDGPEQPERANGHD
jgi:hypothetical protein